MPRMLRLATLVFAGCATSTAPAIEPDAAAGCPAAAGTLTVYAIPPPVPLDWSTPNALLRSVQASRQAGANLVATGQAAITHSIGHVNIELQCGEWSIPLTGQTDQGGNDWDAVTDGAGLLLRDSPGAMDDMATIGDRDETIADVQAREASGKLTRISFAVNEAMCKRLKSFVDKYVAARAYTHYDGAFRARRLEGAGCAIFGAGVIDVGGLLRRSLMTPAWARSEMIGSARIADFLGDGKYTYGGNLVARDERGNHWLWPQGVDVPASSSTPVWVFSSVLDAWSGPEDAPFPIDGLAGEMRTKLPFTIYDPELMAAWAEHVWAAAPTTAPTTAMDVPWTAATVGNAHEVRYDAHCVMPQTIAFDADNDDLFEDSDKLAP